MKDLKDKVAVVTGAASGIGRALARRAGAEGMKVVLADIEGAAAEEARSDLEKDGVEALAVATDVSQADQVSALAERTLDRFGAVHLVFNNAGVFTGGLAWEAPLSDYEWVFDVNVWGVIHGIRTFIPILLRQGTEGHMVNTASMAGVTSLPLSGAYAMSKHAVLALSESLYLELQSKEAKIGVSALCPEAVNTRITHSDRNRPPHLKRGEGDIHPEAELVENALETTLASGTAPDQIAERTFQAVRDGQFYILAPGDWMRAAVARLDAIRLGRNPTLAVPEDL